MKTAEIFDTILPDDAVVTVTIRIKKWALSRPQQF